jgi:hypothetical protein
MKEEGGWNWREGRRATNFTSMKQILKPQTAKGGSGREREGMIDKTTLFGSSSSSQLGLV